MRVTEIVSYLKNFYSVDSPMDVVLFDGKPGCGKTFNVNLFLKGDDKPNYIYISLFGITDLSEIVIRLAEKLESRFVTNINDKYFLADVIEKRPYNQTILVFDDLERTKISFSVLYGLINNLHLLGFKILCISNSSLVKKKDDFLNFREKTFDVVVNIVSSETICEDLLKEIGIVGESFLKTANDNLRLIINAKKCYQSINDYMLKNGRDDYLGRFNLNLAEYFRCLIISLRCLVSSNQEQPKFSNEDNYNKITYEIDAEKYGETVANELHNIFNDGRENYALKNSCLKLIAAIGENDYSSLVSELYPLNENDIASKYPFNRYLFYYSDEEKKKYLDAFFNNLDQFNFDNNTHSSILASVIAYFYGKLSNNQIEQMIKAIVTTVPFSKSHEFVDTLFLQIGSNEQNIRKLRESINDTFEKKYNISESENIQDMLTNKQYSSLTDYLFKNRYSKQTIQDSILDTLSSKDYGLPDLSKTITPEQWRYCNEITKFVSSNGKHKTKFIECLKNQCRKSESVSLRERCNSLTKQYFMNSISFD